MTLYDEDGYAALRKAQRNNEDIEKVPKFATIDLYHPVRCLLRVFPFFEECAPLFVAGCRAYIVHQHRDGGASDRHRYILPGVQL